MYRTATLELTQRSAERTNVEEYLVDLSPKWDNFETNIWIHMVCGGSCQNTDKQNKIES